MQESKQLHWFTTVILFAIIYIIIGVVFSALAGSTSSTGTRDFWRRAAFIVSAVIFVLNIAYEHYRLKNPPRSTALHVSVGVAIAAFILALLAYIRGLIANSSSHNLMLYALVVWPFITAVPAFLLSLAAAAFLSRKKPEDKADKNGDT